MQLSRTALSAITAIFVLGIMGAFATADTPPAKPKAKTVAIFVKNRAKEIDDEKVTALEDLITSKITDSGFHVLSREDTLNSVKGFANAGPNVGDNAEAGAKLDAILSNNTSALRLAQNMGADYVLIASITTFGQDVSTVDTGDVHAKMTESTMEVSYKILEGVAGGSVTGDVVKATTKTMEQNGATNRTDVVNKLLSQAATKLADSLNTKAQSGAIPEVATGQKMSQFFIDTTVTDLAIPEVIKNEDGKYVVEANNLRVSVSACTVDLDGVTIGSTPGPFQAGPGLHKIRVTRDGYTEWTHTISIRDGLRLNVAMRLTDEGYARWRDQIAFLQNVKGEAKLTDAQVKQIEGMAKMFEQSGFRIDNRSDTKVDAKSDIKVNGTSLWAAPYEGRDGRDGRDGHDGVNGINGKDGRDGKDAREPGTIVPIVIPATQPVKNIGH